MTAGLLEAGRFKWRCLLCDVSGVSMDGEKAWTRHYIEVHYRIPVRS